jgi:hypothetical protein
VINSFSLVFSLLLVIFSVKTSSQDCTDGHNLFTVSGISGTLSIYEPDIRHASNHEADTCKTPDMPGTYERDIRHAGNYEVDMSKMPAMPGMASDTPSTVSNTSSTAPGVPSTSGRAREMTSILWQQAGHVRNIRHSPNSVQYAQHGSQHTQDA